MPQVQIIEATYPISHVGIKRVAAYVRVSSSSEDQLNSYAFQIMRYQEIEKEHDDWASGRYLRRRRNYGHPAR